MKLRVRKFWKGWQLPKIPQFRESAQFFAFLTLLIFATLVALPETTTISLQGPKSFFESAVPSVGQKVPAAVAVEKGEFSLMSFGIPVSINMPLQTGLDIQGGTQVTLEANMSEIPEADRDTALNSVVEVLRRRVDAFGVAETNIRTAVFQDRYQVVVELPGIDQPDQALQLIGQTAQLGFRELNPSLEATQASLLDFKETGLGGKQLHRALVQFNPQTGEPTVSLNFTPEGSTLFAEITERNINKPLAIFLDEAPLSFPIVNEAIYGGQAMVSGQFTLQAAQTLAAQLNAGALPVPITVVEQTTVGPTLGQESLRKSFTAGMLGLLIVATFMIWLYGRAGVIAVIGLISYGILTIATYKLLPVTLTLPGIAGLMLSIGMAVDANILTFERMKEELRSGKSWKEAIRLGFGKSWESIKDANLATLTVCFILFNPLEWGFLHTSGPIRGFAFTLALGIGLSLLTGVFFSRLLIKLFLAPPKEHA
jgi:preprotein translocase subunit SecD